MSSTENPGDAPITTLACPSEVDLGRPTICRRYRILPGPDIEVGGLLVDLGRARVYRRCRIVVEPETRK